MKISNTFLSLLSMLLVLCACSKSEPADELQASPSTADLVLQARSADRLYTTEYVVHKIVSYDDVVKMQGKLFDHDFDIALPQGKRKVLIPMEAHIKAYIDFSDFDESNIKIGQDSTITITLPDPKVVLTSTRIDHAGIKTFVDFGRSRFTQGELAEFERQGRQAIINTIPDLGILENARSDAYYTIRPWAEALGYKPDKITVEFRNDLNMREYLNNLFKD